MRLVRAMFHLQKRDRKINQTVVKAMFSSIKQGCKFISALLNEAVISFFNTFTFPNNMYVDQLGSLTRR